MKTFMMFIATLAMGTLGIAGTVAYQNPAVAGNQNYPDALGLDFNVISPIMLTDLGAFEGSTLFLQGTVTVSIYDRNDGTHTALATKVFAGANGTANGGDRFLTLTTPLFLSSGFQGSVVASGYGVDANGNQGLAGGFNSVTNTGGGLISFVGSGRYASSAPPAYPTTVDAGPANIYGAGTFIFQASAVPEPAAFVLFASALLAFGAFKRKRRT